MQGTAFQRLNFRDLSEWYMISRESRSSVVYANPTRQSLLFPVMGEIGHPNVHDIDVLLLDYGEV